MRQISTKDNLVKTIKVSFVVASAFCLSSCSISESQNLQNIIPQEICIQKEYLSKSSGSFDESQGFALYQISQETSEAIMSQGISFFDDITQGKVDKWPLKNWQVTQGPVDYEWINSPRIHLLIDIPKWSDKNIYTLYKAETRFGGGIVIVPEKKLVNVYYTQ